MKPTQIRKVVKTEGTPTPCVHLIALPQGEFAAHFTERGLAGLDFPKAARRGVPEAAAKLPSTKMDLWLRQTRAALEQVLAGKAPRALPPLDITQGSDFQRKVWQALLRIPPGQTRSYAELAVEVGRPRAARAVGNACGANPIPLLIPCHRVLPSSGGLGGFSGPLEWKKRLLEQEGGGAKLRR